MKYRVLFTIGNPWYRQSRSGANEAVQGRSGGAADGKGDGNPIPSNPPASANKPAGGSTGK
jgi:hypothetical protein